MRRWLTLPIVSACIASACARPPRQLAGVFAEITVAQAQQGNGIGQTVRWGGRIVATTPGKDETCFEVVSRPLNSEPRPRRTDESDGRFIACATGFYDPAVFSQKRELTVVGTLQPATVGKVGEYEYHYPHVAVEKVVLWPRRKRETLRYYDSWYDPLWYSYWGPWPYGPWRYAPYWGPPGA